MSTVTVLGLTFTLPAPYAAGHVCTPSEASALNELLRRGFAKGLYKVIRRELDRLGMADSTNLDERERASVKELTDTFIERYTIGFAEGQDKTLAVYEEAARIARGLAETHFNRQGLPAHGAGYDALATRLAKSERVLAEARRRVEDQITLAQRAHAEMLEMLGGNSEGEAR